MKRLATKPNLRRMRCGGLAAEGRYWGGQQWRRKGGPPLFQPDPCTCWWHQISCSPRWDCHLLWMFHIVFFQNLRGRPIFSPFMNQLWRNVPQDGILPGLGKKTQKQREDAFLRLLSNFTVEQQQNLPERVDLMAFFDLLDEHNVQVRQKELDNKFIEEQMPLGKRSLSCRWSDWLKRLAFLFSYLNRSKTRKLTTFAVLQILRWWLIKGDWWLVEDKRCCRVTLIKADCWITLAAQTTGRSSSRKMSTPILR